MEKARWNKSVALNYIEDIANAFKKSKILFTACELDIFTALGKHRLTAKELAEKLESDERATERICNALVSMCLLMKHDFKYYNTEDSYKLLVRGSEQYMGNLLHISDLWDSWSELTNSVRKGVPADYHKIEEKSDEWVRSFTRSYYWKSKAELPLVMDMINLKGAKKLIDIGSGTAHYAIEFAKKYPELEITILDFPKVIEQAEKYIQEEGMTERIKTIKGDFFEVDFPETYDAVFLSYVLHNFSIWDNVKLLQKLYESMNHGAYIYINEVLIGDNRTEPINSTLFSMNLLVNTLKGDAYTETDYWVMLREAWFRDIERFETELDNSLIIAKK